MTEQQFKDIARKAWESLKVNEPMNPNVAGKAVARATFEVRGNHSEVHLSESELSALGILAASLQLKG